MDLIELFNQILELKEDEHEAARAELDALLATLDAALLAIALRYINELDTNKAGRYLFTVANISKANEAALALRAETEKANRTIFGKVLDRLLNLFGLGTRYQSIFTDPAGVERDVRLKVFTLYGIDPDKRTLNPDGYLYQALNGNTAARRIADRMLQGIAGGMVKKEFLKQFGAFFTTPAGTLSQRQFGTFTSDVYMQFDRALSLEYAEQLSTNTHALYAGVRVRDSRDFCLQRLNMIYTAQVIESWNNLEWQGKRPGDVRVNLGGYNCTHGLNWISAEFAELMAARMGVEINDYR